MVKRMLWKDIRQTLSKSKGRVVSIVCLMALGSFALVGLKVTGPDMQATAADFYGRNNLADITVVSNYGISKDDERIIGKADGIKEVEYGYFKDVVISGTDSDPRFEQYYTDVPGKTPRVILYDDAEVRDMAAFHTWLEQHFTITDRYTVQHGTASLQVLIVG